MKIQAIIVDIDGTVAIKGDRDIYDGSKAHLDTPNKPVIRVVEAIFDTGIEVVFTSGRWEQYREVTESWLETNINISYSDLFLRADGDYRADHVIKKEIYHSKIEPIYDIQFILDDRDSVVKMWRSLELPCFQVAEGNF